MPYLALLSLLLIAASGNAEAGIVARAGLSGSGDLSPVQFVQERRKPETIKERVKRAWKDLVGYKFDVSCPILIPLSRTTCTETGKDRGEARAKCVSRNPFCFVADASR
jgi:hypothetical protein